MPLRTRLVTTITSSEGPCGAGDPNKLIVMVDEFAPPSDLAPFVEAFWQSSASTACALTSRFLRAIARRWRRVCDATSVDERCSILANVARASFTPPATNERSRSIRCICMWRLTDLTLSCAAGSACQRDDDASSEAQGAEAPGQTRTAWAAPVLRWTR